MLVLTLLYVLLKTSAGIIRISEMTISVASVMSVPFCETIDTRARYRMFPMIPPDKGNLFSSRSFPLNAPR